MRFSVVTKALLPLCLLGAGLLVGPARLAAQADPAPLGPPISLSNASFEDVPRQANPPRGWYDCGFPGESKVDVHPAFMLSGDRPSRDTSFFEVDNPAIDGNTYLGMVVRDNDTYEAVSQRINGAELEAGRCYTFSIFLAQEDRYISLSKKSDIPVNYNTPAKLRIWSGRSYCDRGELLAESSPVSNQDWLQYNFRFEPKETMDYIVFEAYYKTPSLFPYNGNLLVDLAGDIVPIPCDDEVPQEDETLVAEVPLAEVPEAGVPVAEVPERTPAPRPAAEQRSAPAEAPPAVAEAEPAPAEPAAKLQGMSREQLRRGSVVRIEKLFFNADSSAVTPESAPVLDEIYSFLQANPDVVIEVGGHTNGTPSHEFCDWLSGERAEAVVDYLVRRGIARERLFPKGYGKREPVASNKTADGRRRNQRVELKVLSIG